MAQYRKSACKISRPNGRDKQISEVQKWDFYATQEQVLFDGFFPFFTNVTLIMISLSLELKGKDIHSAQTISAVNTFKCKLEFMEITHDKDIISTLQKCEIVETR